MLIDLVLVIVCFFLVRAASWLYYINHMEEGNAFKYDWLTVLFAMILFWRRIQ